MGEAVAPVDGQVGVVGAITMIGMDGHPVRVEAAINEGLPGMRIVGLPDAAVREAADRLRSACQRSGMTLPQKRLVVNLAPGGLRKTGAGFDLAVALALLVQAGHLDPNQVDGVYALGELGLEGSVRPVPGTLPMVAAARDAGARRVVVAASSAPEAAMVDGVQVVSVDSLREAVEVLAGRQPAQTIVTARVATATATPDLCEVRGQPLARRALEIAAAGSHHLLMVGPPGCGKSMLARRLPGILPPLDHAAALEVAAVASVAGARSGEDPLELTPPFRDPHHSTSIAGLIGGGSGIARPGELSLAHRGVLFLDELLETPRWILDALRQPLESGRVVLVRSQGTVAYPSQVQLVAATNPCPCGASGSVNGTCRCRPDQIERYRARLSGPLLDRIDLHVELSTVRAELLADEAVEESSGEVADRVAQAQACAQERWHGDWTNRTAPIAVVRDSASTAAIRRLLQGVERLGLSVRSFDRCLRVARTIADLDAVARIEPDHVDEALAYRLHDLMAPV